MAHYNPKRLNYCTTRKELTAVVYGLKQFRQYLLARHFTIRTDHAALQSLRRTPEPIGQQGRWLDLIEQFNFDIQHRAGARHQNADSLSRRPCERDGRSNPCRQCPATPSVSPVASEVVAAAVSAEVKDPWSTEMMREEQRKDADLAPIINLLWVSEVRPVWSSVQSGSEDTKVLWSQWSRLTLVDGVLHRNFLDNQGDIQHRQLVMPRSRRTQFLQMVHGGMTGGHLGASKTQDQVQRRAFWPGWRCDTALFCRRCEPCCRYHRGSAPRQGHLQDMSVGMPMERLHIDLTGPHPRSSGGHLFIFTCVDVFTKFAEAVAILNKEAPTVACVLMEQIFPRYGVPLSLLSDQGREFDNQLMDLICTRLQIDRLRTTAYKPSTNGAVERFHRTLNSMIGKVVNENQRNWHEVLPMVMAAYRASRHESTGFSPNFLMFSREINMPVDVILGLAPKENGDVA